jgi:hypothetical protein
VTSSAADIKLNPILCELYCKEQTKGKIPWIQFGGLVSSGDWDFCDFSMDMS